MTKGARVMLSTPPAMAKSISPARMARAAAPTASRPEAQRRFSVIPGTSLGRPGQQHGHSGHVAVVLAGLVGAAEEHFVELRPVGLVIARHQRADRQRGEIVGADLGQRPGIAADRRPDRRRREIRRGSCCASVGFPGAGLDVARRCEFLDVGSGLSCVPTFCDMPTGGQASCTGVGKRTCRADLPADLPSRLAEQTWQPILAGQRSRD